MEVKFELQIKVDSIRGDRSKKKTYKKRGSTRGEGKEGVEVEVEVRG